MTVITRFRIERLTPFVGAEVHGIDLAQPVSDDALGELRAAWHQHGVLFLRNQHISFEQQLALGRRLGEPYVMPIMGVNHPDHPELFRLHADEDSKYMASEGWHADGTGEPAPPMGALFHLHELPPLGGDTLFVSVHAAYERLSAPLQAFLCGLSAEHTAAKAWGRVNYRPPDGGFPSAIHPVVCRHPVTGRPSLWVNSGFTTRIVELQAAESDALLALLWRHLETPDFACRHRWNRHDIALWDNRAVQHCALFNYWPQTRTAWRYTVRGPQPERFQP